VPEDGAPHRTEEEANSKRGEGRECTGERLLAREEQLVEDHGGREPVEEEVVPLDHRPHEGGYSHLPYRAYLSQVFSANVSRGAQELLLSITLPALTPR
jgi:hypothetical protein